MLLNLFKIYTLGILKLVEAGGPWLTPVMLTAQETEIRRTTI
jgi:hypothetical protein